MLAAGCIAVCVLSGHARTLFRIPSFFVITLFLLTAVTALSFTVLYKTRHPSAFLQSYLLTTTFKLLGYGAYNLIILFLDRPGATPNVVFFMFTYLVFTVLEVTFLYIKFSRSVKP